VSNLFPQNTAMMRIEPPSALRRLSFSLIGMALITGVLVRVYRALVLTHGSSSFAYIGTVLTVALLFVVGMTTAHLSNFPLNRWVWRAPAFAGLEAVAELATSLLLIWIGLEPNGTVRAHYADWPGMMTQSLLIGVVVVVGWSLVLAGIVQLVRTRVTVEAEDPASRG